MNRSYDQGLGYFKSISCCISFVQNFLHFLVNCQIRKKRSRLKLQDLEEVPSRFELENKGFADLRLTTWLWHRKKMER